MAAKNNMDNRAARKVASGKAKSGGGGHRASYRVKVSGEKLFIGLRL